MNPLAGNCRPFFIQKFCQFFASFMRYPNWVDVPNFIFILFFSLEIPKKKSIEFLWNLFEVGGKKNKNEDKGFKARFLILS